MDALQQVVVNKAGLYNRTIDIPNQGERIEDALYYRKHRFEAYREGFDEFIFSSVRTEIGGTEYFVHPNVNWYIDLGSLCNGDCGFCIAKTKHARPDKVPHDFMAYVERTYGAIKHLDASIQVTGGEPTMQMPILLQIGSFIRANKIKRPVLNTNGFDLYPEAMMPFEHINVSRHHYNEHNNHLIMKTHSPNYTLMAGLSPFTARVRLQCNLLLGDIDTYGEVMQYIAFAYHRLGVTNISFAQLTPLPRDSFYRDEIIDFAENKQVDIDAMLDQVNRDDRFRFLKYRGGVACYYEIYQFYAYEKPMTILFKFSDNRWLEKADKMEKYIPDFVLHPDGTLTGSWSPDRKILNLRGK